MVVRTSYGLSEMEKPNTGRELASVPMILLGLGAMVAAQPPFNVFNHWSHGCNRFSNPFAGRAEMGRPAQQFKILIDIDPLAILFSYHRFVVCHGYPFKRPCGLEFKSHAVCSK